MPYQQHLDPYRQLLLLALGLMLLTSCAGWSPQRQADLHREAQQAIQEFKRKDPGITRFFNQAHAYAVFPTVGKGGMGIGGAYGEGLVYRGKQLIGRTTLTQVTVGLQLGGQAYSEVIFFEDRKAFNHFKNRQLKFSAQASAVAVKAGASANVDYANGVAVFTQVRGGLMYEASLGGQDFTYEPIN